MSLDPLLQIPLLHNTLSEWLIALGLALVVNLTVVLARRVLARRIAPLAARTHSGFDDAVVQALGRTHALLVAVISLYIASRYLDLPPRVDSALRGAAIVAAFLQVGRWAGALLAAAVERYHARAVSRDAGSATAIRAMGFAARVLLWALLLLLGLDNLGVDVTAMVAGLGIGGIAVALAVQNILGDLLASVSIIADRPFVVGDFIIVDDYMGTVEHVGLKTTHVRSLGGEQIVFANNDLLESRVRNYKRMHERRAVFTFGLSYDTTVDQIELVTAWLRRTIQANPKLRLERAHFFRFGESSLDFEVAYWVRDPDYGLYMDQQQAMNLGLMTLLAENGIAFAYPTRTLRFDLPAAVPPPMLAPAPPSPSDAADAGHGPIPQPGPSPSGRGSPPPLERPRSAPERGGGRVSTGAGNGRAGTERGGSPGGAGRTSTRRGSA
jgi:small-conductance mechanosensitive channel